jgi:hypothetical protein
LRLGDVCIDRAIECREGATQVRWDLRGEGEVEGL